jgi:hypothetical protein
VRDQRRRDTWDGPKHPDHDAVLAEHDRVGQVWEDNDGWVYFIIADPTVSVYEHHGRPFQFKHTTFVVAPDSMTESWPLYETCHRPFEVSEILKRIA